MTDEQLAELKSKEALLYAPLEELEQTYKNARNTWSEVYRAIEREKLRREILAAQMERKG